MSTKFKIALLAGILASLIAHQTAAQFFKTYDLAPLTTRTELGYSLERTTALSGAWTIAGVSNSTPNAGGFDWLFMRLSSTGTVSCRVLLGFGLSDSAFSHVQLTNGRNVAVGFYRAPNGYEKASWSMIDTNCMHVMSRQIVDSLQHQFRGVTKNTADVFTMAGFINSYNGPGSYRNLILAAQYTPAGVPMWIYRYIPPYNWVDEYAYSICYQPFDDSYAITGITNRFTGPAGPYQIFIMKINSAGIPIWFRGFSPIPGAPSDGRKIIPMPDGGFVVTGHTPAFDPPIFNDYLVLRVTSAGAIMWMNIYGIPEFREQSYSIVYQAADTSLTFTGFRQAPAATEEIVITKIKALSGVLVWTRQFPNAAGSDRGYDIELASPSGYGITGQYYNPSSISLDPYLIKCDNTGFVSASCNDTMSLIGRMGNWSDICVRQPYQLPDMIIQPVVNNPSHVERVVCSTPTGINGNFSNMPEEYSLQQNYPNPFNPSTKIMFSIKSAGNVKLRVYNATGELVKELVNSLYEQGNYEVTFDASVFSSGIYFYILESGGFSFTKKMVLVK